jgi:RHS repeat-associated protein
MYDAAGHTLNVQLTGSGPDQDTYTYDSAGRMNSFEFQVGGSNLTGTPYWNPNGTLSYLQIVDGFNSGGSETCYSNSSGAVGQGYDDWGRLVEFDCGSGNWGQQFSFDQYDNLTKSVISGRSGGTWNPGYSSTTNQVNGASYDSNGNMTNDGNGDVSGWNEFSKMQWTASSGTPTCGSSGKCITYDAFGRAVETSNGSAWTEWWYTQVPGSKVAMTGTTLSYGYWPSPGRGLYIDQTGYKRFVHPDWLGNDRIVSSIDNHTITADRAYAPYGEQYNTFGSSNPTYGIFASETGDFDPGILFDTPNRELASAQGRWVSPDPAGASWNAYAYGTNPNNQIDPSGLDVRQACGTWCDAFGDQTNGDGSSTGSWGGMGGWMPGEWASMDGGNPFGPAPAVSVEGADGTDDDTWGWAVDPGQFGVAFYGANYDDTGHWVGENGEIDCSASAGCLVYNSATQQWEALPPPSSNQGNSEGILDSIVDWWQTAHFLGIGGSLWIAHPQVPVGWAPSLNFVSDGEDIHGCIALVSGGVGAKVPGGSAGLLFGDPSKALAIVRGWSVTFNANLPLPIPIGVQVISSSAGTLVGPTLGTPGANLTVGYSSCS